VDNISRMQNVGMEVEFMTLGKTNVKELKLGQILKVLGKLAKLFSESSSLAKISSENFLTQALASDDTQKLMVEVAAYSMDVPQEHVENMGLSDWLKWIAAFKEVSNWEEIKKYFFQILPKELVEKIQTRLVE